MKNNNNKNNDKNNKIEAKESILMKYLNQNDDESETLIEDKTATQKGYKGILAAIGLVALAGISIAGMNYLFEARSEPKSINASTQKTKQNNADTAKSFADEILATQLSHNITINNADTGYMLMSKETDVEPAMSLNLKGNTKSTKQDTSNDAENMTTYTGYFVNSKNKDIGIRIDCTKNDNDIFTFGILQLNENTEWNIDFNFDVMEYEYTKKENGAETEKITKSFTNDDFKSIVAKILKNEYFK
jgi:hypothetical protein